MEFATSKTGSLFFCLLNQQKSAIVGIDFHSVCSFCIYVVEVHLSVDIVTAILGHAQSSCGKLKAAKHMAVGNITAPYSDYWK